MPWQRVAGLGLAAALLAIWSLYVRRRALEVRRSAQRQRAAEADDPRTKGMAA
jgi:hypothetical protein